MEQSTCEKTCAMQMCSNSHAMQRQTPLLMVPNKFQLSVKQVPLSAKLSPFSSPFPPLEVYYLLINHWILLQLCLWLNTFIEDAKTWKPFRSAPPKPWYVLISAGRRVRRWDLHYKAPKHSPHSGGTWEVSLQIIYTGRAAKSHCSACHLKTLLTGQSDHKPRLEIRLH